MDVIWRCARFPLLASVIVASVGCGTDPETPAAVDASTLEDAPSVTEDALVVIDAARETPDAGQRPDDAAVGPDDAGSASDGPLARDGAPMRDASTTDAVTAPRDAAATVTVRLTAPADGATVSGVVPLSATASATLGVARVVFYSQGGGYRIGEDTTAPYGIDWHTAGFVPDGMQRLRAIAIDTAGHQAMHEATVRVDNTPATTLPAGDLARVTAWFEAHRNARYMEGTCRPATYPGWTGIPLKLCRYEVFDTFSGTRRWAEVILADAEPAQLARWVVQAAMERRGRVLRADTDALCNNILGQSGAQFPVAGVVFEDMDGSGQRIFPFRNGVTVRLEGLPYYAREQPTATQMTAYRSAPIAFVGHYGRIAGTMPEEWTALTHEAVPSDRSTWPDIVGRAYRAAWGQDRNALIVAWARANL